MTLAYWMVLVAAFLPFVFAATAKFGGGGNDFDNRAPRAYLEQLSGWRQRANWAQQNQFEAFPPFAAGVIIAHQVGAAQGAVDTLAVLFILLRLAFGVCYVRDLATLRSLIWMAAFACIVGLFVAAAVA
ncbi:putative MAPEG superfamily protein [Alkalispirillum mobile]|uniref:Putative MAPEG superfamily protein n=1 Tax=Alkalispirillum mobile TaxID=85925 RepID=A0A498C1H6_9GAMM|nr:MAPEG family protein [Alkalispirillum mobile]RLK48306.1 putative MAPEG superfamily protein [Alkalispirillum mobile]